MIRKEIGSDWEIYMNRFFLQDNFYFFRSCRDALNYIAHCFKSNIEVVLPAYSCDSVITPFSKKEDNIKFYGIDNNFKFLKSEVEGLCEKADILLLIDYFGISCVDEEFLKKIKNKNPNICIIIDKTQNFFGDIWYYEYADYVVCSLRKWFSLPDGGLLVSKNKLDIEFLNDDSFYNLKLNAGFTKYEYLHNLCDDKSYFLDASKKADTILSKMDNYAISDFSYFKLLTYDISQIKKIRAGNFVYLKENMTDVNISKIEACENSLYFPILTKNRDVLQQYLSENNVYCPVIWELDPEQRMYGKCGYLSDHILCIPIDQRYTLDDMEEICYKINCFQEKNS
ncbi:hypothetical protein GSF08_02245 [Clostridiaceae bacterium DONG20-135]|uniref:DegT/DnrJ/EryC1/StrS aminotransferase family protein n=1 Tax=Copranaerobaculum intestinale TaxID=2692629 RepID=A0A6N8UAD7_9FIRM|nr:hypothetical protein [Copranaerobaculum intestinale]MXQ72767.1 hypothetical protein [Copranaerobaculum intestinale]